MCMILAKPTHRIGRLAFFGPKTVYKVMKKTLNPTVVRSPHIEHEYVIGTMQTAEIGFRRKLNWRKKGFHYDNHVYEGIHAFVNLDDAYRELEELSHSKDTYRILRNYYSESELLDGGYYYGVYRCEIPQYAKYFRGFWDYHYPHKEIDNIVSTALVIVEEVK